MKNTALLLASLLITLLLGEYFVRTFEPQKLYRFPKGMFISHPTLQYKLTREFDGTLRTVEYKTGIHTNSAGLREDREYGPKPQGVYRILAIGDSFTMGVGVEAKSTFIKVLERKLNLSGDSRNVEAINAGVPGYNTIQELNYLLEDGLDLQPDLILVSFFIGNDIVDNHQIPSTIVVDGFLRSGPSPDGILPPLLRDFLGRQSHLYNFIWPIQRRLLHDNAENDAVRKQQQYLSIYARKEDANTSAMWASTRELLGQLDVIASNHSINVAVVIIPDQFQINPEEWNRLVESTGDSPSYYDRMKPVDVLVKYCENLGIPALNLLPELTSNSTAGKLYLPLDGHWTVYGNKVAGHSIADFLDREGLAGP